MVRYFWDEGMGSYYKFYEGKAVLLAERVGFERGKNGKRFRQDDAGNGVVTPTRDEAQCRVCEEELTRLIDEVETRYNGNSVTETGDVERLALLKRLGVEV